MILILVHPFIYNHMIISSDSANPLTKQCLSTLLYFQGCPADVDLVFVLDSSSSLGVVENPDFYFLKEIAFVIDVIKLGNIDFRQSRVSVITYSDVIRLHQYRSETDLVSNIIHLPFLGGNTCTDIALDLMLDELNYFKSVSNGRKAAIGVILTDGLSTRPESTSSSARRIHDVGYRIVAIGNLI